MDAEQRVAHNPPGWFGKVPMLGDFAHRRLPTEIVARCDEWLSACIATSRRDLAQDWLGVYLSAPLWCFAWAPRVADASWWFGVLMPSVDGVGRYFPLIICRDSDQAPARSESLSRLAAWYDAVAQCALAILAPGATLPAFEAQLKAVDDLPHAPADDLPTLTRGSDGTRHVDCWLGASSLHHAPEIALRSALAELDGHSYWWPQMSPTTPARIALVPGLPPPTQFAQMLQGLL